MCINETYQDVFSLKWIITHGFLYCVLYMGLEQQQVLNNLKKKKKKKLYIQHYLQISFYSSKYQEAQCN